MAENSSHPFYGWSLTHYMKQYLIPHRLDEYKDFHDTDWFDDFFCFAIA